ncbi:kinase-like domain-containing protein [Xylaria curta]|nr:kinase-like domain-containing protein [Xylaria curta]
MTCSLLQATDSLAMNWQPNLVACLGADLRYLSLHFEWPGVRPLGSAWIRDTYFTGELHDASTILADCAQALSYLSSHAIVHNNVTPYTIVYVRAGAKGKAVLTDFDCAMSTSGTYDSTISNPCYVAPEAIKQNSEYADVWSLGIVMLFAMKVTGLPGTPEHIRTLGKNREQHMTSWHKQVDEFASTMNTSVDSTEGSELRQIVKLMLEATIMDTESETASVRISPTELGNRTKKWASMFS